MARQIEKFANYRLRYPWDDWSNGAPWEIVAGIDFKCECKQMATNLHIEARRRGVKVKTSTSPDGTRIRFQFGKAT